jgi:hypothetical protein
MLQKKILALALSALPLWAAAQNSTYTPAQAQAEGQKAAAEIGASGIYSPTALGANPGAQGGGKDGVFGERYNSSATQAAQSALKSTSSNENLKNFGQTAQDGSVAKIENTSQGNSRYTNDIDRQSDEATFFITTGQQGDPYANPKTRTGAFGAQSVKANELKAGTGSTVSAASKGLVTGMGSTSSMQCGSSNSAFTSNSQTATCTRTYKPYETWCEQRLEIKSTGSALKVDELSTGGFSDMANNSYESRAVRWRTTDYASLLPGLTSVKLVSVSLGDYYEVRMNGNIIMRSSPPGNAAATLIGGRLNGQEFKDKDGLGWPYYGTTAPECASSNFCPRPDFNLTNLIKEDDLNELEFACFSLNAGPRKCGLRLVVTANSPTYSTAMVPSASCAEIDKLNKPLQ